MLDNQRAEYGKSTVSGISQQLEQVYGRQFAEKNLRRMMRFADVFSDFAIVAPVVRQLSWSHFLMLLPLETEDARKFYAQKAVDEQWSKRELQHQIERKAYERQEIATLQLTDELAEIQNTFKDPYFLD